MALDVSAYAQTTWGGAVVHSYKEHDLLGNPFVYNFEPGMPVKRFPKVGNRTVSHRTDGTALDPSNTTEDAADVSLDIPVAVHDLLTYQQVNTYGLQIPSWYSKSFGEQLAERIQNIKVAYALKVALGDDSGGIDADDVRTDGNGVISFNDEDETGAEISDAIFDALAQMSADKVPTSGRIGVLHPKHFNRLRKRPEWASRDYVSSNAGNEKPFEMLTAGGIKLISLASIFNTDISANTAYAAKYRCDFTEASGLGGVWGVIFHDQALAMHEVERPNGKIDDIPNRNSWQIQARAQFGMGTLQPNGCIALAGDAS